MKTTYWKRESIIDGSLIALFKIEEDKSGLKSGYIFKKGEWKEYDEIILKAKYDDDYDYISEEEARRLMDEA